MVILPLEPFVTDIPVPASVDKHGCKRTLLVFAFFLSVMEMFLMSQSVSVVNTSYLDEEIGFVQNLEEEVGIMVRLRDKYFWELHFLFNYTVFRLHYTLLIPTQIFLSRESSECKVLTGKQAIHSVAKRSIV